MAKDRANRPIAEAEARRVWSLYDLRRIEDLQLDDLAFAMGVSVVRAPLEGAEARLVRRGKRGLIRVRAGIGNIGQERFAIAHELGHWVLHRASSQILACTSQDLLLAYRSSPEEQEASVFASVLLMPDAQFKERAAGLQFTATSVRELADVFQTSLTAAAIRFVETSSDYTAVIASRDGRIEWCRPSDDLHGRMRVSIGGRVPESSVAASVFAGRWTESGPEEVPFDDWSEEPDEDLAGDVLEDVIHLARFGTVLSLISLP